MTTRGRRGVALRVAAALVIVVLVGAAGFVLTRGTGASPATALPPPRFVEETATAGIDQTYAGAAPFEVGGGVAVFDCNGDGKPDIYLAGGSNPAALYRNDSPIGGALRFTRLPDPATDLTGVTGAYPLDIDGDGQVGPRGPAERRGDPPARPGRVPLRARERALVIRRRDRVLDRLQRHVGGLGGAAHAGPGPLPAPGRLGGAHPGLRRQRPAPAGRGRDGLRPPDRPGTRLLRAVDAVQRLGRLRPARPAGEQRQQLLRSRERRGAALARRARPAAAPLHRCGRLGPGPARGDGHRQLRPHRERLPGRVPHEPGRQPAPAADLGSGPADLPRHGRQARRERRRSRSRAATSSRRRPGTRSSRTSTTTGSSTSSSPRATSMPSRASP